LSWTQHRRQHRQHILLHERPSEHIVAESLRMLIRPFDQFVPAKAQLTAAIRIHLVRAARKQDAFAILEPEQVSVVLPNFRQRLIAMSEHRSLAGVQRLIQLRIMGDQLLKEGALYPPKQSIIRIQKNQAVLAE